MGPGRNTKTETWIAQSVALVEGASEASGRTPT
jgi:hypothetical protein